MCPNSVELWKTLRRAAEIRRHEEILGIAVNSPDEIPEDYYHRKCRSIFNMKKDLDRIHANEKTESRKDTESAEGHLLEERRVLQGFMKRYAYFAIRKTNTSAIPPPVIAQDLTRAHQAGETAFQDFKNNRLEPDKPLVSSTTPSRSRS